MKQYTPEEVIELVHAATNQYMIGEGYFKLTVEDLTKLLNEAVKKDQSS